MSSGEQKHNKNDIYVFLKRSFFGVLSYYDKTSGKGIVKSELMIFNTTDSGDFYLTMKKPMSKFGNLSDNSNVTIMIYKEEERLRDISRIFVNGEARIITDLDGEDAEKGFELIGQKSPVIKHLVHEKGDREKYTLVHVKAKLINFISLEEIMNGEDPTILARK